MRSLPSRPRPRVVAIVLAFALSLTTAARSQDSPADASSLARYVPRDGVILHVEYDGLDAHADAWKKTAAYKILNNTPAGEMLETLTVQLIDRFAALDAAGHPVKRGAEVLALVKHVARSGFLFARVANKDDPKKSPMIVVIRNGFKNKEIRPTVVKLLQGMNAPNTKFQSVVRAGHKVVGGTSATGMGFAWWVEETKQEDVVGVVPGPEAADVFLETLDGKRPNAIGHPRRVELARPEAGFVPTGFAFLESSSFEKTKILDLLGLAGLSKLDFRWGFQDEALMSITRLVTPSPRKGLPGLLEGTAFDKAKLPLIPPNVASFTAAAFDMPATVERLVGLAKAFQIDETNPISKSIESMKAKTKLRLKEDLLAHLGPKVAWYSLPGKSGVAASSLVGLFNPAMEMPRLVLAFDIDDPKVFGTVLDQAMTELNRELKAQSRPPGEAPAKGGRARGPSSPALEFKMSPGETKTYILNIPPELAGPVTSSFKPTIQVGAKQVILATSPEVVRVVVEAKAGWSPPKELATGFEGLPSKLKMLNVSDPRETMPALLATLPGRIQTAFNTAMLMRKPPTLAAGLGGVPGGPGGPPIPDPNAGGGRKPMAANPGGGGGTSTTPGAPAPGIPTGGSAPLAFQIEASKLPSADAIKGLLFPSMLTVESADDTIRIVTRDALPTIGDPSNAAITMSLVLPAIQAMRAGRPVPGMAPAPGRTPSDAGKAGPAGNSGGGNKPTRPD